MPTSAICQPHALDATISWLSPNRRITELHGQAFLTLQLKTLALLAALQLLGG